MGLKKFFLLSSAAMEKNRNLTLRAFRKEVGPKKRKLRRFLTKLSANLPKNVDLLTAAIEPEVWKEVDCLGCANCCKQMTPTYTPQDIKRIAAHENMTPAAFKEKWLYKDRSGDWMNKSTPCQFLNLSTNMCRIYEVRPVDCAGFPHLAKRKLKDYIHIHKQNVEYCPATLKMVEKLKERVESREL